MPPVRVAQEPVQKQAIGCRSERIPESYRRAGVSHWEWSRDTKEFCFDGPFLEDYGYRAECLPLTLKQWQQLIHPMDLEKTLRSFKAVMFGAADCINVLYRMRTPSGNWVWLHVLGRTVGKDGDGTPVFLCGTVQDVTEIKKETRPFHHRESLLPASCAVARILMDPKSYDFDRQILMILDLLGTSSNEDTAFLWQLKQREPDSYGISRVYECFFNVDSHDIRVRNVDIPLETTMPTWLKSMRSGNYVNEIVRFMPQMEKDHLAYHGFVSILAVPIVFEGKVWGMIGFGDCTHERAWDESEISIMKNVAGFIEAAVRNREMEEDVLNRFLATSSSFAVITTDGVVKWGNNLFFEFFPVGINDPVVGIYRTGRHREEIAEELLNKNTVSNRVMQYRCKDGLFRDFLVSIQKIDYDGRPSLFCWGVDVTDREKNGLAGGHEAHVKARNEFLSKMNHEIRNPMNAILGMTHLCLQTDLTAKQKDYLRKTQTATTVLLDVVNDMLGCSKIEAGESDLDERCFRISKMLREIEETVRYGADEKGLRLDIRIGDAVPDHLRGDPLRLRQVLLNLANNAVKYTERGSICIAVDVTNERYISRESNMACFLFSVKDTGIGMARKQIERLFEQDFPKEETIHRQRGGQGSGLAISKQIVDRMGGSMYVDSTPGHGSTFRFTAHFFLDTEPRDGADTFPGKRKKNLQGASILLAEDNKINQMVVSEYLQSLGIHLVIVDNGLDAVEAVKRHHFDMVLMDVQMPVMDGLKATREIRKLKKPEIQRLPIIAMTANAMDSDRQKSLEVGMNEHLTKPIDPRRLRQALETWID